MHRQLLDDAAEYSTPSSVTRQLDDAAANDSSPAAEDCYPASVAFLAAAGIWFVILISLLVIISLDYRKERKFLAAAGRAHHVPWKETLTRSIMIVGAADSTSHRSSLLMSTGSMESEVSVRQTSLLDVRYNFQTIFLALVQASISMIILGGIQLDFDLTIYIVFGVVAVWTVFLGIVCTVWMSYLTDPAQQQAGYENDPGGYLSSATFPSGGADGPTGSTLLHDILKQELHNSPLSFVKQYIEVSFLSPMIDTSTIYAGDIYQDIGRDGSRTILLGVGQIILLSMYVWDVVGHGKPDFSDERLYSFYCCGIVLQVAYLSGQDILYKSIYSHLSFWGNVLRAARSHSMYTWEPPRHLLYHRPRMVLSSGSVRRFNAEASLQISNTPFLWLRFLFSTSVNVGGLNVITLLLPLQLASDNTPLRFVMSAVGAYYILGIDDYGEPIKYKLETTRNLASSPHGAAAGLGGGRGVELAPRRKQRDRTEMGAMGGIAEDTSDAEYHRDLI